MGKTLNDLTLEECLVLHEEAGIEFVIENGAVVDAIYE